MTSTPPSKRWDEVLRAFPETVRADIARVRETGGTLDAAVVGRVLRTLGEDVGTLMIRLLPVAAQYAIAPISDFHVGAVAKGMPDGGFASLYLGANVEFVGQALSFCVHGEQSALTHAWLGGEVGLQALAVSAAPCGYCRQFLHEIASEPQILLPTGVGHAYTTQPLGVYLPSAFGPRDLGVPGGLMDPKYGTHALTLKTRSDDALVQRALTAASRSYAPYSENVAGCAILLSNGHIYPGRYAENAAYNPSMSPLESAVTFMNMSEPLGTARTVTRAVLVEVPTRCSQLAATAAVLSSFAPGVTLEYYQAVLE